MMTAIGRFARIASLAAFMLPCALVPSLRAQTGPEVDTALILAVDVSNSVDAERYRLQMEGIARALEDDGVVRAITGGPRGGILLALVSWGDRAHVSLDWQSIRSASDAQRVAELIRTLPQETGEFTCMARMMDLVRETVIASLPLPATRVVVDVSGDGIDNCDRPADMRKRRDDLVAAGVTINGLPIIVKGENDIVGSGAYRAPGLPLDGAVIGPGAGQSTLDTWYRDFVVGGPAHFLLPAQGFGDFGRAFRQKFLTEISALE